MTALETAEAKPTCDNCGNDVEVELDTEDMTFRCMPCRGAKERGDDGTLQLRRLYLKGEV